MQTLVARLADPYGECEDPNDVDKTLNAYAEHYPVLYTAHVSFCVVGLLPSVFFPRIRVATIRTNYAIHCYFFFRFVSSSLYSSHRSNMKVWHRCFVYIYIYSASLGACRVSRENKASIEYTFSATVLPKMVKIDGGSGHGD